MEPVQLMPPAEPMEVDIDNDETNRAEADTLVNDTTAEPTAFDKQPNRAKDISRINKVAKPEKNRTFVYQVDASGEDLCTDDLNKLKEEQEISLHHSKSPAVQLHVQDELLTVSVCIEHQQRLRRKSKDRIEEATTKVVINTQTNSVELIVTSHPSASSSVNLSTLSDEVRGEREDFASLPTAEPMEVDNDDEPNRAEDTLLNNLTIEPMEVDNP